MASRIHVTQAERIGRANRLQNCCIDFTEVVHELCMHAYIHVCVRLKHAYARVGVSQWMGDSWRTESTPSLVQKAGRRKGGAAQLTALHALLSVC